MTRKIIYSLVLICFLGLLSSANQRDKDCVKELSWLSVKAGCPSSQQKAGKADTNLVPLNLFLFDL